MRKAKTPFRLRYGNSWKKPGTGRLGRFCRLHSGSNLVGNSLMSGPPRVIGILTGSSRILSAWSGRRGLGKCRRFRRWIAPSGSKYRKQHGAFFRGSAASLMSCAENSQQVHEQLSTLALHFMPLSVGRACYPGKRLQLISRLATLRQRAA